MEKNKKTKRKGNLKYSLLLLLLLAILLISSTYAWFTANRTVTVSELAVNVEAQNGLQISADAINWKTILSNEDITTAAYSGCINQIPATMEPVSTAGNITDGDLDMFYGTVNASDDSGLFELTATKEATPTRGSNGRFIAFDAYLRVDETSNLKLTQLSNVISNSNKGLQNSGRVAFLIQGHTDVGEDATTLYSSKEGSELYIWEPNYDVHTAAAVQNAYSTYGTSLQQTGEDQQPYDGVSAEITTPIPLADTNASSNGTYFTRVTPDISTEETFSVDKDMFTLQAGVTKVRIYMWVEGQDVDCENNASGSDIRFNLQFTIAE